MIDAKNLQGKVRVERVGGLFSPRHSVLLIAGRDRTHLIGGVECQIESVRAAIARAGEHEVDVGGAVCLATADGLPWVGQLSICGIIVDGPKTIAQLVRRPGPLAPAAVGRIWRQLASAFPQA